MTSIRAPFFEANNRALFNALFPLNLRRGTLVAPHREEIEITSSISIPLAIRSQAQLAT